MVKTFNIRRAGRDDVAELAVLFDGYRQFYKQESNPAEAKVFLTARLEKDESVIFVAENEQGVGLGFTQLYPMFSSVRMKPIWILNDLFVAKHARKLGVANALMDAAEKWAKSIGAVGLELATAKDNAAAKSVYSERKWQLDTEYDHYSITL